MVADALIRMGRADAVEKWVDGYLPRLEDPPAVRWGMTEADAPQALGQADRVGDWCALFLRGASAHPNRPRRQGAVRAGKPASPQRAGPGVGLLGREVAAPAGRSRAARPSAGPASGHRHGHLPGTTGATRSGTHGTGRPRRTRGGGGGRLSDLGSQQPHDARARRDGTTGCQPGHAIDACRPLGGDTRRRPIRHRNGRTGLPRRRAAARTFAPAILRRRCDGPGGRQRRRARDQVHGSRAGGVGSRLLCRTRRCRTRMRPTWVNPVPETKWVWWNSSCDASLRPPSSAAGWVGCLPLRGSTWHVLRWRRRSAP